MQPEVPTGSYINTPAQIVEYSSFWGRKNKKAIYVSIYITNFHLINMKVFLHFFPQFFLFYPFISKMQNLSIL